LSANTAPAQRSVSRFRRRHLAGQVGPDRARWHQAEAEAIDAAEDAEFGVDRRGDELSAELQTREGRLSKMREAKAAIEAEAAERAAEKAADKARNAGKGDDEIQSFWRGCCGVGDTEPESATVVHRF